MTRIAVASAVAPAITARCDEAEAAEAAKEHDVNVVDAIRAQLLPAAANCAAPATVASAAVVARAITRIATAPITAPRPKDWAIDLTISGAFA